MSQFGTFNRGVIPPPPTVATEYDTDFQSPAIPALNILQVKGGVTLDSELVALVFRKNIHTAANPMNSNLLEIKLNDSISLPNTSASGDQGVIYLGGATSGFRFMHNYGISNTFLGLGAGNFTLLPAALSNVGVGTSSIFLLTTGSNNTFLGWGSGINLTSGSFNVGVGAGVLNGPNPPGTDGLRTGNHNVVIGHQAGSGYTLAESSNILIGSSVIGTVGENNTLRIGDATGVGNGNLSRAFICGIDGVNVGSTSKVVTMGTGATADQLGTATITAGTGINVGSTPNVITISASGSLATSYDTDFRTPAVPLANVLQIKGGATLNTELVPLVFRKNIHTTTEPIAGTNLLQVKLNDSISFPNTSAAGDQGVIYFGGVTATDRFLHNFGTNNTFVGPSAGNFTLTTAASSVGIGTNSLRALTTGSFNTALGHRSLEAATTALENTALGYLSLISLVSGTSNIAIGGGSGTAYAGAESNNLLIFNPGILGENTTIRIGTSALHNRCFIAGIDGINIGSTAKIVTMGTGGTVNQLGTATITAGTGITITPTANVITISSSGTTTLSYTNVNTTPYVVLSTDEYLSVDCSGGPITLQFPNAATLGREYVVKDRTGSANTNPITVTTVGGAVNIDGATTYSMNTQFAAIQLIGNASTYEIF